MESIQNEQNTCFQQIIDIENINSSTNEINYQFENFIDNLVKNTNKKLKDIQSRNIFFFIYSKNKNNFQENEYYLNDIQYCILCNLQDIIFQGEYDTNIKDPFPLKSINVHYLFKIKKLIHNELFSIEYNDSEYYSFEHTFSLNEELDICNFIFNQDIAIFKSDDSEKIKQHNQSFDNLDSILYTHAEFLSYEEELYQLFLTKIEFKESFIQIDYLFESLFSNKNDLFFKYLFLKEFNTFLELKENNILSKIEFKENCMIEGEKINNTLFELKNIIEKHHQNEVIINYIKNNMLELLT